VRPVERAEPPRIVHALAEEAQGLAKHIYAQWQSSLRPRRNVRFRVKPTTGIYGFYLVADAKNFHRAPTSDYDRTVRYGLDAQEWSALFASVLPVGETMRADFPLLSRFRNVYQDFYIEADEVLQLREECVNAKALASDPIALSSIAKILRMCDEARKLRLGIFFDAP